jgi:glutamate synthase (NADPH/NADH) large chain
MPEASQATRGPGLYDPANEHDSCGVGFVVNIKGRKSHDIIRRGLEILVNLDHRGAVGADPLVGDGAGCLIQTPDALLRHWADEHGLTLPPPGRYAVAMCFLPMEEKARAFAIAHMERFIRVEGQELLAWREVPTDTTGLGKFVLETMPHIAQAIVCASPEIADQDAFERKILTIRKQTLNRVSNLAERHNLPALRDFYIPSFSTRTVVYKGLLLAPQVGSFYEDLRNPLTVSGLALVHQRFSTNTFPSWRLAHPYRFLCHNGEINTVRGNVNWIHARRQAMSSPLLGADLNKMTPLVLPGQSDTACIDNALELLVVGGGYSLAHAMMMLIPEAWSDPLMDPDRRAFYEYHAALMEPWDGPAAIAFTDGRQIGATLDRNGLRPARYIITDDDHVILASEAGVLPIPEERITRKWRLQPGKMLLIDLEEGRIIGDDEIKQKLAAEHPYEAWLKQTQYKLSDLPEPAEPSIPPRSNDPQTRLAMQQAFGYTQEDIGFFLEPMARDGDDPIGSMGTDTPIAAFSNKPKVLYNYFKQNFAQVTNPPIDPIREELVMSLISMIGPRPNLLGHEVGTHHRLEVSQPILTDSDLDKIRNIERLAGGRFNTDTLDITWLAADGPTALEPALDQICRDATEAVLAGHNILILSDRAVSSERAPIPALLATSAVHHHLIREGLRTRTGIVVETGDAVQVHDFCVLAGYGAEAINPYLAFATLEQIRTETGMALSAYDVQKNYLKAVGKGLLKVMSKMGISTYQSYCGAQIFDAVGLESAFIDKYFTGTATTIEGSDLNAIATEALVRHAQAYGDNPLYNDMLDVGGDYAFRLRGEAHAWTPHSIGRLQHAVRGNSLSDYKAFADIINDQSERLLTIRGLMKFKPAAVSLPLDEVEPAKEIVKRFATGAMSFGSISREAHTTLAIAMNRIGGKSNTGEGGEESERFKPLPNGDSKRSAIKQVASGRFGVTTEYLVNADVLQIKMAQGAKPGEGGQLPGHKVDKAIAKVRHSTPGVGLISPPPHHDIYSIEDLAQLIHDLKNANPKAAVSVKLVSEVGVGTVAAGVAKGTGRPCDDRRVRGRHWRQPVDLADPCRLSLGNRPGRDPADPGAQRIARPHRGAGRRRPQHGPRCRGRRAVGRRRIRLRHRAADRLGLHHDAQMPSQHLPGGHRDAGPGAARPLHRPARARHQLLLLCRRGSARDHGQLGFRTFEEMVGRVDRLDMKKAVNHWKAAASTCRASSIRSRRRRASRSTIARGRTTTSKALDQELIAESHALASNRASRCARNADPQCRSHRGRDAVGRDRATLRPCRAARRYDLGALHRHRRSEFRRVPLARRHRGAGRRRQRLCRQGPFRWPHCRPPSAAGDTRADREHHRRQYRALRRDCRRGLFRRRRGRAFRGEEFGRDRGGRRHRRPRLRVYDRRRGGRAGQDRAQFRRRHVGRRRLCLRRERPLRRNAATRPGRS